MTCEIISPPPAGDGAPARACIAPTAPTLTLRAFIDAVGSVVRTHVVKEAWVEGAVVSVRRRGSGYALELGENDVTHSPEGARLEAFLSDKALPGIRQNLGLSAFDPTDLAKASAILRLTIKFHPRYHLQAVVKDVNPGLGNSLHEKNVARIRSRLAADGLLNAQSRLRQPPDIRRLAVVHPEGAAAWSDVAKELTRLEAANVLEVIAIPAAFEGLSAVPSLLQALQRVRETAAVDAVLMIRGGGASSGLATLADERLARAICSLPVPVVTGIGHASDRGLCDELAWRAADTPSKALRVVLDLVARPAALARQNFTDIGRLSQTAVSARRRGAGDLLGGLTAAGGKRVADANAALDHALSELRIAGATARAELNHQAQELDRLHRELTAGVPRALNLHNEQTSAAIADGGKSARARLSATREGLQRPDQIGGVVIALLDNQVQSLEALGEVFIAHFSRRLESEAACLSNLEQKLRSLSVQDTLARGFILATADDESNILTSATEARKRGRLRLHFSDGVVAVRPETAFPATH